jgi:inosine/xanthosine triphosphatase
MVLPEPVSKLIRTGTELGHADDIVFGKKNSKQGSG